MNTPSPLRELEANGQSVWLDHIDRRLLQDGTLRSLIDTEGVSGLTSNPAIFRDAIAGSGDYRPAIVEMARRGAEPSEIYERLVVYDIRKAADMFLPLFRRSGGADGYVSLEITPAVADDTEATLREARRLWMLLQRANGMIKVPATQAGLPAIQQLIAEGVNVNATLVFSPLRYREVLDAYFAGLEQRLAERETLDHVHSVASFFVSRIDTLMDQKLDEITADSTPDRRAAAQALRGETATAFAGTAYRHFQQAYAGPRWQTLAAHSAHKQRLLWASTRTKDAHYSDTKYVDTLIGPETITTLPLATLRAYRGHGRPNASLSVTAEHAPRVLQGLHALGFDLSAIAAQLEREGVQKFLDAYLSLLDAIANETAGGPGIPLYGGAS